MDGYSDYETNIVVLLYDSLSKTRKITHLPIIDII